MSQKENEKRKREKRNYAHLIAEILNDRYPQIERIKILYEVKHLSFVGATNKKGTLCYTPQNECFFIIPCLNEECSTVVFDLSNVISSAICAHKTEISDDMRCEGQEAPDYPEQRCSGKLKYTIKIKYMQ